MEQVKVVKQSSREEVALELTKLIAAKEKLHEQGQNFRKSYLDLYAECWDAAGGYRPNK